MMQAIQQGQPEKAIALGQTLLTTEAEVYETNFIFANAYNALGDFEKALPYIEKAEKLAVQNWQKSWVFVESIQTYFGLGKLANAEQAFEKAQNSEKTKNAINELNYFGILMGFDAIYKDWVVVETKNLIFHFQPTIAPSERDAIAMTRQVAFEKINTFFHSDIPKKIDFFVWDTHEAYQPLFKRKLGFTKPEFCLSHNRMKQSAGHEIAHSISHWKNKSNVKTQFINEGIGVCFDLNKNDKLAMAKKVYKTNAINIREVWRGAVKIEDEVLYPIAGAFVDFLIKKDKEKFLLVVENQTYENALQVYQGSLEAYIDEFINSLAS